MMIQEEEQTEQTILNAIRKCGVYVNKEELIKAMNYDRNQYSKGYKDGVIDVLDKIKADLWMEGVNMTDEYQGVWVRYRDIERTIDKYKASSTGEEGANE